MRRSRSEGSGPLFNAETRLSEIESELAKIFYIAGIEFNQVSDVDMDEIFFALRQSFHMSSSTFNQHGKPYFDYTRKTNFLLTNRARHLWFERQIVLAALQNG